MPHDALCSALRSARLVPQVGDKEDDAADASFAGAEYIFEQARDSIATTEPPKRRWMLTED